MSEKKTANEWDVCEECRNPWKFHEYIGGLNILNCPYMNLLKKKE